ncbi:hypothetical protein HG531_004486 [Fusarium graminearum]|nr:hypothetical protein HG531_004486 [Fusarium graminearum]
MDLSSQGLVETDDEVTECALSRTASSDNKGYFARWKEEVRFFEYFDRGVRGVCKAHLLNSMSPLQNRGRKAPAMGLTVPPFLMLRVTLERNPPADIPLAKSCQDTSGSKTIVVDEYHTVPESQDKHCHNPEGDIAHLEGIALGLDKSGEKDEGEFPGVIKCDAQRSEGSDNVANEKAEDLGRCKLQFAGLPLES